MGKLTLWRKFANGFILCIAIISIAVFIANTDFIALKNQLKQVGFKFTYILLLTFTAYFLGTLGWWLCLGQDRKNISLFRLFAFRQIGETLALYNPTSIIAGDLLKVQLLKPYQINQETALKSVTSSRITATLSQISLFTIAMIWLLSNTIRKTVSQELTWIITCTIVVLLLLKTALFIALYRPTGPSPIQDKSSLWRHTKTTLNITFYNCKVFFQHDKKNFWYSYLFFAFHWIVGSMELYLLLLFMGYSIQPMDSLVLDMSIIVIKSIGAAIPGQIGIEEFANKITLDMIGIKSATIWISISILRRFRQVIWSLIGVLLSVFFKVYPSQLKPEQLQTSPTSSY